MWKFARLVLLLVLGFAPSALAQAPAKAVPPFAMSDSLGQFWPLAAAGSATTGYGIGVVIIPSSTSGIVAVPSAAAEGSHVLCSAPCSLYSTYVTTGATGGYLLAFDATSAPADGAVTPKHCIAAPAMQTSGMSFGAGPAGKFAVGLTVVFSTTGCFTKTISATAFFAGSVQ